MTQVPTMHPRPRSLETEYYLRGTMGRGMDDADAGPRPGRVQGGRQVAWKSDDYTADHVKRPTQHARRASTAQITSWCRAWRRWPGS